MTITRLATGEWELCTRHGQLIGRGDLYTVVMLWARMRRAGWSDTPYGQPATCPLTGRRTVECTETQDCECRACTTAGQLLAEPAALEPRGEQRVDAV